MKALNNTRWVSLKYPRNTPRISRKKLWYDRSEWRQAPDTNYEAGTNLIDQRMEAQRGNVMGPTNYNDLPDMTDRVGRAGLKKF